MPRTKPEDGPERRGEKVGDRVSIFRRGRVWHANWQEGRRQRRRSLGTASKKEATLRAWKLEREIGERVNGSTKPLETASIDEAIGRYRDYLVTEGRAKKTLAKYDLVFRRLAGIARRRGVTGVDGIDPSVWDAYRASRRRDGAADKTLYTESVVIRQLVKFAVRRKLVAADPLTGVELRKPKYKPQPCWTRAEAERVVAAAREPFATAFAVLLETGLRAGELSHLTRADVDFAANVLHVRPKEGWSPKTGEARAVPMTARVATLLRPQIAGLRPGDWVFRAGVTATHAEAGRRLTERRLLAAVKRVTKRLGLPGHLHTFRHGFISHAVLNGVPEAVIRKWVGHVDPEILKLYTHIHDDAGQAEMRRLAGPPDGDPKAA